MDLDCAQTEFGYDRPRFESIASCALAPAYKLPAKVLACTDWLSTE
jgi:hypothetical protein